MWSAPSPRYNSFMRIFGPADASSHPYAWMGYANPDAVTQIANGVSTSTFTYDNNGNLAQKTTDGVITTYVYDYANRLTALGSQGATTTYGYDAFGSRVFQSTATTTTLYPFKWYSVASSTGTGAKYATTTEYVFNGDSLISTADQQTASGAATGTAQTRYIHPDHLGSTNVVTNASGTVVQTLDYYPYGATRISTNTGGADSARKYIGQFTDPSNLDYLNARYYDSSRGQFLTEDPIFWAKQNLSDPQSFNSYSYSDDNPISKKDPSGQCPLCVTAMLGAGAGIAGQYAVDVGQNIMANGFSVSAFTSNLSDPQTYLTRAVQGAIIGGTGGIAGAFPAIGIAGQSAIVGVASGVVGAGGNWWLGQSVTPGSVFLDSAFGALTFGLAELAPGIPGRFPNFGTKAFFMGAHTQQNALRVGVDAGGSYLSSIFASLTTAQARVNAANTVNSTIGTSAGSGGGGQPNANSVWVTPSGAVVTWGSQLVAPPPPAATSKK